MLIGQPFISESTLVYLTQLDSLQHISMAQLVTYSFHCSSLEVLHSNRSVYIHRLPTRTIHFFTPSSSISVCTPVPPCQPCQSTLATSFITVHDTLWPSREPLILAILFLHNLKSFLSSWVNGVGSLTMYIWIIHSRPRVRNGAQHGRISQPRGYSGLTCYSVDQDEKAELSSLLIWCT